MSLFLRRPDVDHGLDVEELARIRLQTSPYRALRRVHCQFHEGTLILHGRVATYHYKQLAQVTVAGLEGVRRIVNELEVEASI